MSDDNEEIRTEKERKEGSKTKSLMIFMQIKVDVFTFIFLYFQELFLKFIIVHARWYAGMLCLARIFT